MRQGRRGGARVRDGNMRQGRDEEHIAGMGAQVRTGIVSVGQGWEYEAEQKWKRGTGQ